MLDWCKHDELGREWHENLPHVVQACTEKWALRRDAPYRNGYVSLVIPATLLNGIEVVLKIQFPHDESEYEAQALQAWQGNGAIQLIDHDPDCHALLLERCRPGTPLSNENPKEALSVFAGLLPKLWLVTSFPFRTLREEARGWNDRLEQRWEKYGRPFPKKLIELTQEILSTLPFSQGEQVLLHQDLHGDNVLRAQREPWLAIDPKPLVGEREFSVAPIIRSSELGHNRAQALYRLDYLCAELGLNRERALLWTIAQTIAWSFGGNDLQRYLDIVAWLLNSE
jgi:streptomycin 6-kinase